MINYNLHHQKISFIKLGQRIFITLLLIIIANFGILKAQSDPKPPYPIIFVHGWAGSDETWKDSNGNWQEFFTGTNSTINWECGGTINICLNNNVDTIPDNAANDVDLVTALNGQLSDGDFYFVNFDVNKYNESYPDNIFGIIENINSTETNLVINPLNSCNNIHIHDIIAIDSELMEVIGINTISGVIISIDVRRGAYNTINTSHVKLPWSTYLMAYNLTNESNQSSVVRGGLGIKKAIDTVKDLTNSNKVILVAHSMGGLHSRQYIQNTNLYVDDVIKLITISTPHQGSNRSNLPEQLAQLLGFNYDLNSSAVRDMRYRLLKESGTPSGDDDAPFLFDGDENCSWHEDFGFYCNDMNGDGDENQADNITGLNSRPWPSNSNILIHFIVGQRSGTDGDDIVRWDRQILPMDMLVNVPINNIESSTIEYNYTYWGIVHTSVNKEIDHCMDGLDEPDNFDMAYDLAINQSYNGFTTFQTNGVSNDYDWYKFEADNNGVAIVTIDNIYNQNYWVLKIYDANGSYLGHFLDNNLGLNSLQFPIINGNEYLIRFNSHAIVNSYMHPYSLQVTTQSDPFLSQGTVTPESGLPTTQFTFNVTYLDPGGQPPDSDIEVVIEGTGYQMNALGSNWSQGVTYTYSDIFPTQQTYQYYFEGQQGSTNMLCPETGYFEFNVSTNNTPPVILIQEPDGDDIAHDIFVITWLDQDPDNNAEINLYMDNNNGGFDGIQINSSPIYENNSDYFTWDVSSLADGSEWYVYGVIDDQVNPPTNDYSSGPLTIDHPDWRVEFSYQGKSTEEDEGDGDGVIEEGESFDLGVKIRNDNYSEDFKYVIGRISTSSGGVEILDDEVYYGYMESRESSWGDDEFDIQVQPGFTGNVSFTLHLTYSDLTDYLYYQTLDIIPDIYISPNVSPSFEVVDFQFFDNGSKCNNDGILNSGEKSIEYLMKLQNNGLGEAIDVTGTVQAIPEFNTSAEDANYPDITSGGSQWPESGDEFFIGDIPADYAGVMNANMEIVWGDENFNQMISFNLDIQPAPWLSYTPHEYDFGVLNLGETASIPVEITNFGSSVLIISQIEDLNSNPGNTITGIALPYNINPGSQTSFNINITRDSPMNVDETFRIHSNNHNGGIHDVNVIGTFFNQSTGDYSQYWRSGEIPNSFDGGDWVEAGDFDLDGLIDIVTIKGDSLFIWEQIQSDSFEFQYVFACGITNPLTQIEALRVGNCDGDAYPDIVIKHQYYDGNDFYAWIRVFESIGDNQYIDVWNTSIHSSVIDCLGVGDCDGDGLDEIISGGSNPANWRQIELYESNGNNSYSKTWDSGNTIVAEQGSKGFGFITTGDVDQDGNFEIILAGDDEFLFIWEKSGSGYNLFHSASVPGSPNWGDDGYPIVSDVDNDNTMEVIIAGENDGWQITVINPISWSIEWHNSPDLYDDFTSPAISDLNNNNSPEIFMGEENCFRFNVFESINTNQYAETWNANGLLPYNTVYNIVNIDLNNDLTDELVLSNMNEFLIWGFGSLTPDLPDLRISSYNISFSIEEPCDSDTITITAIIQNIGTEDASDVSVDFYKGDPGQTGLFINNQNISTVVAGGSQIISYDWIPLINETVEIFVVVDSLNTIAETDEVNNRAGKQITVIDNDTVPPIFSLVEVTESNGDNDDLIEDNESIQFVWHLEDISGINETYLVINNDTLIPTLEDLEYDTIVNNLPVGSYPILIYAKDDDNSFLEAIYLDTVDVIQHAPNIIDVYPDPGMENVLIGEIIEVQFDIDIDPSTVNVNSFIVFEDSTIVIVPFDIYYDYETKVAFYDPGLFSPNTSYLVYLISGQNGIKDLNGNTLDSTYHWSFSTEEELAADFSAVPTQGTPPLIVQFTDQSTGTPTSWSWEFGDGNTSTEQNPEHTYTIQGTYTVSLTVSDGTNSDTEVKTDYITVNEVNNLQQGIVHYYKLDSDLIDCIGGVNGTNFNTLDQPNGFINHAREFSGANNCYVDTYDNSSFNFLHNGSDFTISIWEKHNSGIEESYMMMGNNIGGDRRGLFFSVYGDNVNFSVGRYPPYPVTGNNWEDVLSPNTTQWNHLVVTYDNSISSDQYTLYVNGQLAGTGNRINPCTTGNSYYPMRFGINKLTGTIQPFEGDLDEISFWDRKLDPGEITTLYNNGDGLQYPFTTVPIFRNVQNITISNTEAECYDATNTITVAGSGTTVDINSGGHADFIAGYKINFEPGFHAHDGSYVNAYITLTGDYCSQQQPMVANNDTLIEEPESIPEIFVDNDPDIRIYPNPNTGQFIVVFLGEEIFSNIMVYNFQGNQLYQTQCNKQRSVNINLGHLPNGIYIVVIRSNFKVITKKISKI